MKGSSNLSMSVGELEQMNPDAAPPEQAAPRPKSKQSFPTDERLIRRDIDRSQTQTSLTVWAKEIGITLGPVIPEEDVLDVLQTLWTYKDLDSTGITVLGPPTDLITHRTKVKPGTTPYKSKPKKYAPDKEWWLRKFVADGLDNGMYERTVTANGRLSPWGADSVIVRKDDKPEPRLTFNYHFVYEEMPANHMQLAERCHEFLSMHTHKTFSQWDLKNAYWSVGIHPKDRFYYAFYCPGYGQLQPTRMPQGARSSSFTMNEMSGIMLGPIPSPAPEPSLISPKERNDTQDACYYIDDIFTAHSSWAEEWSIIKDQLLPRFVWAKVKISFRKVKIGVTRVLALGQVHEAGGTITIKPERVRLILEWPVPMSSTQVRSFLGTIATTRRWVKNFSEIARPLSKLTGKSKDFRWGEAEQVSFDLLRNICAAVGARHGWVPRLPVEAFFDASGFAMGCFIMQLLDGKAYPLFYDSLLFTAGERKYDTYKRELKAMVTFVKKHSHYFQCETSSTLWTDHKPLVGFLNAEYHEDIFARWAQTLRLHNVTIKYIKGERNQAADGLSRTIFDAECAPTAVTKAIQDKLSEKEDQPHAGWFWKSGKGGYEEWLKTLTEQQRLQAVGGEKEEPPEDNKYCGWTTFGFPEDDNIFRDQNTLSTSQTSESTNQYADIESEWYHDLIQYYQYQKSPVNKTAHQMATFKRLAEDFRWDSVRSKLVHKKGTYWVTCIGPSEVLPLLNTAHDEAGHFGPKIVLEKIQLRVWWPCMEKDIQDYIKGCFACAKIRSLRKIKPLSPIRSLRPFQIMVMDHIGPLPVTNSDNTHVLNLLCCFSRFTIAQAVPSTNGETTVQTLKEMFDRFATPVAIYADQGAGFKAIETSTFLRGKDVELTHAPAGAHRAAGLIERSNRLLRDRLKTSQNPSKETAESQAQDDHIGEETADVGWEKRLQKAVHSLNHRFIESLGYKPVEIALGVTPGELMDLEHRYPSAERENIIKYIETDQDETDTASLIALQYFMCLRQQRRNIVREEHDENQRTQAERYDPWKASKSFKVGDRVLLWDHRIGQKALAKWRGPLVITGPGGDHGLSWKLRQVDGKDVGHHHSEHLQKITPRRGYLQTTSENTGHKPTKIRRQKTKYGDPSYVPNIARPEGQTAGQSGSGDKSSHPATKRQARKPSQTTLRKTRASLRLAQPQTPTAEQGKQPIEQAETQRVPSPPGIPKEEREGYKRAQAARERRQKRLQQQSADLHYLSIRMDQHLTPPNSIWDQLLMTYEMEPEAFTDGFMRPGAFEANVQLAMINITPSEMNQWQWQQAINIAMDFYFTAQGTEETQRFHEFLEYLNLNYLAAVPHLESELMLAALLVHHQGSSEDTDVLRPAHEMEYPDLEDHSGQDTQPPPIQSSSLNLPVLQTTSSTSTSKPKRIVRKKAERIVTSFSAKKRYVDMTREEQLAHKAEYMKLDRIQNPEKYQKRDKEKTRPKEYYEKRKQQRAKPEVSEKKKAYLKQYRIDNKEVLQVKNKARDLLRKDYKREYNKNYHSRPEVMKRRIERLREYRRENRDLIRHQKRVYYYRHREHINAYQRRYSMRPEQVTKRRARSVRFRTRLRALNQLRRIERRLTVKARLAAYMKVWRQRPEIRKRLQANGKAYYLQHKDRISQKGKARWRSDPEFRLYKDEMSKAYKEEARARQAALPSTPRRSKRGKRKEYGQDEDNGDDDGDEEYEEEGDDVDDDDDNDDGD